MTTATIRNRGQKQTNYGVPQWSSKTNEKKIAILVALVFTTFITRGGGENKIDFTYKLKYYTIKAQEL